MFRVPPMKQTRAELIQNLAVFALAALAAPLEKLAAAGRRAFDPPPRPRRPAHSVKRNG